MKVYYTSTTHLMCMRLASMLQGARGVTGTGMPCFYSFDRESSCYDAGLGFTCKIQHKSCTCLCTKFWMHGAEQTISRGWFMTCCVTIIHPFLHAAFVFKIPWWKEQKQPTTKDIIAMFKWKVNNSVFEHVCDLTSPPQAGKRVLLTKKSWPPSSGETGQDHSQMGLCGQTAH